MCGRYATTRSAADLSELFEALDWTGDQTPERPGGTEGGWAKRYNVAPTDPAPVVRLSRRPAMRAEGDAGVPQPEGADAPPRVRVLALGRWGLLPHWARDPRAAARMINARAETVATARAYRDAFAGRRALVPVDGWYEWRRDPAGGAGPGARQAYFLTPRDGSVLALAGLWSRWGPDGLLTFCVLTTAAVGELASVHDRMPLVLPRSRWQRWLGGEAPHALLGPPSANLVAGLEIRPVGPAVGNVRNDGPELVKRVDPMGSVAGVQATLF